MQPYHSSIRQALVACLLAAPLLQLVGDAMWVSRNFPYAWSIWREASYVFFIPVGFLLAKRLAPANTTWALMACALYVIGCFGAATMMPLFRLGAFYPINGHNEFPAVVQSVLHKKAFAITLYIPGLCFPVSLILFGAGFLKYNVLPAAFGFAMMVAGLFFWLGNAAEIDAILVVGDAWLLLLFGWLGYFIFRKSGVPKGRVKAIKTGAVSV